MSQAKKVLRYGDNDCILGKNLMRLHELPSEFMLAGSWSVRVCKVAFLLEKEGKAMPYMDKDRAFSVCDHCIGMAN